MLDSNVHPLKSHLLQNNLIFREYGLHVALVFNPASFAVKVTLPFFSIKEAVPVTLLLLFDSNVKSNFFVSVELLLVLQLQTIKVVRTKKARIFFMICVSFKGKKKQNLSFYFMLIMKNIN